MRSLLRCLATAAILLIAMAAAAQSPAYLHGTVLDPNNNPIAGATVRLGGREFVTRDDGRFLFDRVAAGKSILQVEAAKHRIEQNLVLEPGRYTEQTIVLGDLSSGARVRSVDGARGEILRNVGINSYASVSPRDGSLAVEVLSAQTRRFDIWHVDRTGRQLAILVSTDGDDQNPRWSPDGSRIVFHRQPPGGGYEVWVKNLGSGDLSLVDHGLTPAWSPDGRSVVYAKSVGGNWDIHTKDLQTGVATRLTTNAERDQYPYWGRLGKEEAIVFASKRTGTYEIWAMRPDGSAQRRLSTVGQRTRNRMVGPVLSPDGVQVAFWEIDYTEDHSVWIMNHDGTGQRELVKRAANPEWDLAQGVKRSLLFDSKITGRAQVWRMPLDRQ